jgi:hypothetical protein
LRENRPDDGTMSVHEVVAATMAGPQPSPSGR